jgi:regulator of protease activity HflC (stomatin/prohibitin superfamily)
LSLTYNIQTLFLYIFIPLLTSAHIFRTIGTGYQSIIVRPAVEETIKDITSRYPIEVLITERARVSADITTTLQQVLGERGLTFERFNIADFAFSAEFSHAIEAVRIAEQNALRAEQDLVRVQFEAQAEIARAEAQAEVLRLQARELTETNLQAMWIESWNGVLPQVVSDGSGLLINIPTGNN